MSLASYQTTGSLKLSIVGVLYHGNQPVLQIRALQRVTACFLGDYREMWSWERLAVGDWSGLTWCCCRESCPPTSSASVQQTPAQYLVYASSCAAHCHGISSSRKHTWSLPTWDLSQTFTFSPSASKHTLFIWTLIILVLCVGSTLCADKLSSEGKEEALICNSGQLPCVIRL